MIPMHLPYTLAVFGHSLPSVQIPVHTRCQHLASSKPDRPLGITAVYVREVIGPASDWASYIEDTFNAFIAAC